MAELMAKLLEALNETIESIKREIALEALVIAWGQIPAVVPGVPPMKRIDNTSETDLDSLTVSQLDAWLSWNHGYCQAQDPG